jgi:DNA-binding HxlR family transcriptional regulator
VRWDQVGAARCSIARTLSVIGDRWTLLVLRDCFLGVRRFDDFQRDLGVSPHLLSTRLSRLVESGLLERHPYRERPRRDEYRLTEKGLDLYPVVASLLRWGDRWMWDDEQRPPVALEHRGCGRRTTPTLTCSECGEPLEARAVRARVDPSALPVGSSGEGENP